MDRRDFLTHTVLGGIGLVLPYEISEELTIVDIKFIDGWFEDCVKMTGISKDGVNCELNIPKVWLYIRLIDDEGREWTTSDQGKNWECGNMAFSVDTEEYNGSDGSTWGVMNIV